MQLLSIYERGNGGAGEGEISSIVAVYRVCFGEFQKSIRVFGLFLKNVHKT